MHWRDIAELGRITNFPRVSIGSLRSDPMAESRP